MLTSVQGYFYENQARISRSIVTAEATSAGRGERAIPVEGTRLRREHVIFVAARELLGKLRKK